jgi:hypothetical protein
MSDPKIEIKEHPPEVLELTAEQAEAARARFAEVHRTIHNRESKYYTAFLFAGKTPSELHCTHKYLGKLPGTSLVEVIKTINGYFLDHPAVEVPQVAFTVEDFFGGKFKTRVLRPLVKSTPKLLPDLRKSLAKFGQKDTYTYRPHVTCDEITEINEPFDRYVLVGSGGVIIKEWRLK